MTRMWLYLIDALINKTRKPNFLKTDIFSFVFMKKNYLRMMKQLKFALQINNISLEYTLVRWVYITRILSIPSWNLKKKKKKKSGGCPRNIVHFHSLLLKILWSSIYFICACFISLSELHDSQYDRPQSSAASHDETITVHSWIWLWINC